MCNALHPAEAALRIRCHARKQLSLYRDAPPRRRGRCPLDTGNCTGCPARCPLAGHGKHRPRSRKSLRTQCIRPQNPCSTLAAGAVTRTQHWHPIAALHLQGWLCTGCERWLYQATSPGPRPEPRPGHRRSPLDTGNCTWGPVRGPPPGRRWT